MDLDLDDVILAGSVVATIPEPTFPEETVVAKDYKGALVCLTKPSNSQLDQQVNQIFLQNQNQLLTQKNKQTLTWAVSGFMGSAALVALYSLLPKIAAVAKAAGVLAGITCCAVTAALGCAAVAFTVTSLAKVVKEFFKEDLDKPAVRSNAQEKLERATFDEMAKKYSFEKLIGYDLLAKRIENQTALSKLDYYEKVQMLYEKKSNLDRDVCQDKFRIESIFLNKTRNFRNWYFLSDSALSVMDRSRQQSRLSENRRNFVTTAGRLGVALHYQKLMAPWNAWRSLELSSIKHGANSAMTILDHQLRNLVPIKN